MIAFADGHVSFCLPQLHVCGEVNACVDQPVQQVDSLSVNEHTSILLFPALLQLNSMAVLSKMLSGINSSRRINKIYISFNSASE